MIDNLPPTFTRVDPVTKQSAEYVRSDMIAKGSMMKDFNQQLGNFHLCYESGDMSVGLPDGFIFIGDNLIDDGFDLILSIEEVRQLAQLFSSAVAAYDAPETGGDLTVYERNADLFDVEGKGAE